MTDRAYIVLHRVSYSVRGIRAVASQVGSVIYLNIGAGETRIVHMLSNTFRTCQAYIVHVLHPIIYVVCCNY